MYKHLFIGILAGIAISLAYAQPTPQVDTQKAPHAKGHHTPTPPPLTNPIIVTPEKPYISIFPPVEGGKLLDYLKFGKLTTAQCLSLQRGGITSYEAAINSASSRPELAAVVAMSKEILAAMKTAVVSCPALPLNPFI